MNYYDRDGNVITLEQWCELTTPLYKRVAQDTINGKWVSTVWIGLNHAYREGEILIFETMVFEAPDILNELYMDRYATEIEALEGHFTACQWVRDKYGVDKD